MFTIPLIRKSERLDDMVSSIMQETEMEILKHNGVTIGAYMVDDGKLWPFGGKASPATEVEKTLGFDVILYISGAWAEEEEDIDIEAKVYQLMINIQPTYKGKENNPSIEINRERDISVSKQTVAKYGTGISWYKSIYEGVKMHDELKSPKNEPKEPNFDTKGPNFNDNDPKGPKDGPKDKIPKNANEDAPGGIYKYGVDDEEIANKEHK